MPKLIVDNVRPTETGVATGMNTVVRTVGGVIGAQVGAVLLAANVAPGTACPPRPGSSTRSGWGRSAPSWRPSRPSGRGPAGRARRRRETARDAVLELDTV